MELFPLCNDYYKFNPIFCFNLLQMILEYVFWVFVYWTNKLTYQPIQIWKPN